MSGPKFVILFLVMMVISYIILDGISVTAIHMNLNSDLERAVVNAMYASTHLGALRNHDVKISKEALEEKIRETVHELNIKQIAIKLNAASETPPLVDIEAQITRRNYIGKIIPGVEKTDIQAQTIVIGDFLPREENYE